MLKCLECGNVFEDDEIARWEESRGEYWGMPCHEDMCGCPKCHGDFVDAVKCKKCGEYVPDYEVDDDGVCDECKENMEE